LPRPTLFSPIQLGSLQLSNRIVIAPLRVVYDSTAVETPVDTGRDESRLVLHHLLRRALEQFYEFLLLFSADGVLMSANHVAVQTTKLIERALQRMSEEGYQDLRLETTRVENSGDMAMELGRYRLTVHGPDGTTRADEGKYLTSWRRMGAWRILATCWSSNQPLTNSHQSAA
jgi:ketosteroid isomerase-like protein